MKKKMEGINQPTLFNLANIKVEDSRPRQYWYYVTTPRNMSMVVGLADDGTPIFADNDTRPHVAIIPHLFSTRRQAERYRDKHVAGGHTRKWLYSTTRKTSKRSS